MVGRRRYHDGCAVAHGLDLIGERWALLVVRELLLGPKRFTDLRAGMPGASPDVLTQRLRELQQAGVVQRRKLPPPASAWVYELTEWGAELEPVVTHLGRWAGRSPSMRHDAPIGADSLLLSLKALFDPYTAAGFDAVITLAIGDARYQVHVTGDHIDIARDETAVPQTTLQVDTGVLSALLHDGLPLDEAQRTGQATVSGDPAVAERFLTLFPLPEPALGPSLAP
ncbi:MAG: winged helix-turn-helix transcriptional regulator [Micromonosporaceae bacterium]